MITTINEFKIHLESNEKPNAYMLHVFAKTNMLLKQISATLKDNNITVKEIIEPEVDVAGTIELNNNYSIICTLDLTWYVSRDNKNGKYTNTNETSNINAIIDYVKTLDLN